MYLCHFLSDKRVIALPAWLRCLLVYGFILPFRTKASAHAYRKIWTPEGSPLFVNSLRLQHQLQKKLGSTVKVALAMRYGPVSIKTALQELKQCSRITVLPLYPQYSSSATGSSIEAVLKQLSAWHTLPHVTIINEFYNQPSYLQAQAEQIQQHALDADFVLFSYHGLPQYHLSLQGCHTLCQGNCPSVAHTACYRRQCFTTTELIAQLLELKKGSYGTAFQSRLGRAKWIQPYTEQFLSTLVQQNVKKLAIVCPSFVADCLETLEEIQIRLKETWISLGGDSLKVVPSLNDQESWVDAIIEITGFSRQSGQAFLE